MRMCACAMPIIVAEVRRITEAGAMLPVCVQDACGPFVHQAFPFRRCCRSSGVEHSLGKGEVESSNLSGSTIKSST